MSLGYRTPAAVYLNKDGQHSNLSAGNRVPNSWDRTVTVFMVVDRIGLRRFWREILRVQPDRDRSL